jgi:hypothetical protein
VVLGGDEIGEITFKLPSLGDANKALNQIAYQPEPRS